MQTASEPCMIAYLYNTVKRLLKSSTSDLTTVSPSPFLHCILHQMHMLQYAFHSLQRMPSCRNLIQASKLWFNCLHCYPLCAHLRVSGYPRIPGRKESGESAPHKHTRQFPCPGVSWIFKKWAWVQSYLETRPFLWLVNMGPTCKVNTADWQAGWLFLIPIHAPAPLRSISWHTYPASIMKEWSVHLLNFISNWYPGLTGWKRGKQS